MSSKSICRNTERKIFSPSIYIYIYIEKERERDREHKSTKYVWEQIEKIYFLKIFLYRYRNAEGKHCVSQNTYRNEERQTHLPIYIYIYMSRNTEKKHIFLNYIKNQMEKIYFPSKYIYI